MSRRQFTRGGTPPPKPGISAWILLAALLTVAAVSIGASGNQIPLIKGYFWFRHWVVLNTEQVDGGEVFYATTIAEANCIKDLPLAPTQAYVTLRITARHDTTGAKAVLNPGTP